MNDPIGSKPYKELGCDAVLAPTSSYGLKQPPLLHDVVQTPQF